VTVEGHGSGRQVAEEHPLGLLHSPPHRVHLFQVQGDGAIPLREGHVLRLKTRGLGEHQHRHDCGRRTPPSLHRRKDPSIELHDTFTPR